LANHIAVIDVVNAARITGLPCYIIVWHGEFISKN